MRRGKIIALLLAGSFALGLAASGAYALPECGVGLNAAPMRMEGCAGGSGCCGCEMETTLPRAAFDQIALTPSTLSPDFFSEETNHAGNSLRQSQGLPSRDVGEEEPSHPGKLYDIYSDYRI